MKRRPPVLLLIFLILTLYPLNLLYSLFLGKENILLGGCGGSKKYLTSEERMITKKECLIGFIDRLNDYGFLRIIFNEETAKFCQESLGEIRKIVENHATISGVRTR